MMDADGFLSEPFLQEILDFVAQNRRISKFRLCFNALDDGIVHA
jgi:hypothetical protein